MSKRIPHRQLYFLLRRYFRPNHKMTTLETLKFDNLALQRLPIDPENRNYVRTVAGACFSKVSPTPVSNPQVVAFSLNAIELLDLSENEIKRKEFVEYFSGNKILPGSETAAHCYCGHQFGYFSGQLGDGAAIYLGEVLNQKVERWEIQLKGAGLTPYSRSADGRKVLRSTIREFLCSEAMHFLDIPTTRAGVCITSDSEVVRDIYYDGHPKKEKCTIVLRIAPTFLRFGSFEIFKTLDPVTQRHGPSVGRGDILIRMLDYVTETFFPQIHSEYKDNREKRYAEFFKEVVLRTARLVAQWQCVGFCHGVLNTDNMSILGLTIDYGPFGFMDIYNPDHICNASDDGGRYSYRKQPEICLWNLQKFAEALQRALPLSLSVPLLDLYNPEFQTCYMRIMRNKLGLMKEVQLDDRKLSEKLLETMEQTGADFTNTFRCLSTLDLPGLPNHESSLMLLKTKLLQQCYPFTTLIETMEAGVNTRNIKMLMMLSTINPQFAERLQTTGVDFDRLTSKMEKLENLKEMSVDAKRAQDEQGWNEWLQMYIEHLRKESEGLSQDELQKLQEKRIQIMNNSNPRYILRNYIAQNAISKAEKGDYTEVRNVLKCLENPFDDNLSKDLGKDTGCSSQTVDSEEAHGSKTFVQKVEETENLPPDWSFSLKVT